MVTATLSYKTARIKFYIAVPKTPLDNQLQYKSHIARNLFLSSSQAEAEATLKSSSQMIHSTSRTRICQTYWKMLTSQREVNLAQVSQ